MKVPAKLIVVGGALVLLGVGTATAGYWKTRTPVEFYPGHYHTAEGETVGAPAHRSDTLIIKAHSGGLDRNGCHNASVPYHCH